MGLAVTHTGLGEQDMLHGPRSQLRCPGRMRPPRSLRRHQRPTLQPGGCRHSGYIRQSDRSSTGGCAPGRG